MISGSKSSSADFQRREIKVVRVDVICLVCLLATFSTRTTHTHCYTTYAGLHQGDIPLLL